MNERSIFLAVLEVDDPAQRAAYLAQACGDDADLRQRVEELLKAHEQPKGFMQRPAPALVAAAGEPPLVAETAGAVIGPYKLLELVGEGGMGTVWMAEQTEPIQRRVAVKVIKAGMDSKQVLARFEAERQALALMDHPHIAKVLDADTTGAGRPYFVMELVKGTPITKYCDDKHLSVRERLELFGDVCRAVQHAHQKGIIHRDLKPSNILIAPFDGKPVVKVIDFGVAKATGQRLTDATLFTGFGAVVGTPEYMSPEQAETNNQDIDTRSDIYSLGVLLYELLTGSTPLTKKRVKEAALLEVLRVIREEEPPKPSTRLSSTDELPSISAQRQTEPAKLTKLVRGDLDWIVMKALEKDRNRRYETANGFAMDLQRYLADEPVQACPPSMGYRLRKFARRNKAVFVSATLLAAALIVGTTVSSYFAFQAKLHAEEADANAITAKNNETLANTNAAVASAQKELAQEREKDAKASAMLARRRYYGAQINLAWQAWKAENPARVLELLETLRPTQDEEDLRTFEWYCLWRACNPGHLLTIHERLSAKYRYIRQVAFLPGGKTLMIGGTDPVVRFCNVETGAEERRITGGVQGYKVFAVSPDGKTLAHAAGANTLDVDVVLWDVATGRQLRSIRPKGWTRALAFSPDGKLLVTPAEYATSLQFWDVSSGKEAFAINPTPNTSLTRRAPAFAPDGRTLAVARDDGRDTQVLDLSSRPPRVVWEASGVPSAFSPDGGTLATSEYGKLTLWDVATRQPKATYTTGPFWAAAEFSPDGKKLAMSGYNARAAAVIDLASGRKRNYVHLSKVDSFAFSPDSTILATAAGDGDVKLWDLAAEAEPPEFASGFNLGCFSPDGRVVALRRGRERLTLFDFAERQPRHTLATSPIFNVALSPDGTIVATGAVPWQRKPGDLTLWEVATGNKLALLPHPIAPWSVAFSPNGKKVATGSANDENSVNVRLWDLATRKVAVTMSMPLLDPAMSVAFHPDGSLLAGGGQFGSVHVFDTATGKRRFTVQPRQSIWERTPCLAFSKDDLLAAGTGGGEIRIWDMGTQRLRTTLKGHTCETESLAFFPDGLTLVSRDLSGGVKFWDMTTHQERLTSDGHTFVSIAPGGEALLLGDRHDGTVRLWRTATDREATRRQGEFEQQADTSRKTLSTKQSSDLNGQSDGAELGKQRADAYGAQVDPTPPPTEPTPKTWQGWHARGHAQLRAQRWDDALDAFAMVIELHKDDNKWHVGDAWHQTAGIHARWAQADKAIEGYTKAIELDPGNHYHWNGRAQVYLRSGELEKALAEFDRALQLDQGNPHIWMGRAQAHLARRQPDEAFADIREAVRRGFDNVAHLRNAPDFAPLRQRAAFQELLKEMEKKAKKQ